MSPEIEAVTCLIRENKVWEAVRPYLLQYDNEFPVDWSPERESKLPTDLSVSPSQNSSSTVTRRRAQSNSQHPFKKRPCIEKAQ